MPTSTNNVAVVSSLNSQSIDWFPSLGSPTTIKARKFFAPYKVASNVTKSKDITVNALHGLFPSRALRSRIESLRLRPASAWRLQVHALARAARTTLPAQSGLDLCRPASFRRRNELAAVL